MKFSRSVLLTSVTLALQLANPVYALPRPCTGSECVSLTARTYVTPATAGTHYKRQFDFDFGGLFGGGGGDDNDSGSGLGGLFGGVVDKVKDTVVEKVKGAVKKKATELKDKVVSKVQEKVGGVIGDILGNDDDEEAAAAPPAAAEPPAAPPVVEEEVAAPPPPAKAAKAAKAAAPPPPAVEEEVAAAPPPAKAAKTAAAKAPAAATVADIAADAAANDVVAATGTCGAPGINGATVNLIKSFEGFVASPEPDPIGLPTVGFGHLCKKSGCSEVPFKFPLTDGATGTAAQLLQRDVGQFVTCINSAVKDTVTLNDNEFGALVSWAFNVGCGAAKKSTLMRRLNAGESPQAVIPKELPKFNKAGGRVLKGLTRRRAAEVKLAATASNVKAHPC